jgi:hypothetical protein
MLTDEERKRLESLAHRARSQPLLARLEYRWPARFVSVTSVPGAISGVWAVRLEIPSGFTTSFTVEGIALRKTNLVIWSK